MAKGQTTADRNSNDPFATKPKRRRGRALVLLYPDEPTSIPREEIERAVKSVIADRKKHN